MVDASVNMLGHSYAKIAPGNRCPDALLLDNSRLFSHVWNGKVNKHALLLQADAKSYGSHERTALQVAHHYGNQVNVFVVVPSDVGKRSKAPIQVLVDSTDVEQSVASKFGVAQSGGYLVRPDGYIAYFGTPLNPDHLMDYLATVFID